MSDPHRIIFLIRHAKARSRSEWTGDDLDRPLTPNGEREALVLAEMLGGEPISRIMSSPARRCVETVEPLCSALGITLDVEESLIEGSEISLPDERGAYIICAHGDNIPPLLDRLNVDSDDCHKGSVWRIELDESGGLIRADYSPPPAV